MNQSLHVSAQPQSFESHCCDHEIQKQSLLQGPHHEGWYQKFGRSSSFPQWQIQKYGTERCRVCKLSRGCCRPKPQACLAGTHSLIFHCHSLVASKADEPLGMFMKVRRSRYIYSFGIRESEQKGDVLQTKKFFLSKFVLGEAALLLLLLLLLLLFTRSPVVGTGLIRGFRLPAFVTLR